ncbi:MAG: hemolysin [Ignavibacteriae bacterium HGW-Ignavibacteriae-1]|jgi:CBS domain containing-hemolysin-like protein|nr:MAG: hemolysin [Ignavibacteriae bacterium HGW-Ignavibacteriae-1]
MDNAGGDPYTGYENYFNSENWLILLILLILSLVIFASIKAGGHALKRFRSYFDESELGNNSALTRMALNISDNFKTYSYAEHVASTVIFAVSAVVFYEFVFHFAFIHNADDALKIALLTLSIVIFGILSYIFGVVIPRNYASKNLIFSARFFALLFRMIFLITFPIVHLIKFIDNKTKNNFQKDDSDSAANEGTEEIRYLIEESSKSGYLDEDDHELMENVIDFTETTVKQIMVPRNKIVAAEINSESQVIIGKIIEEGYSRMPVFEKTIDNIIGIVNTRDILIAQMHGKLDDLRDFLRETVYTKENENIDALLKILQQKRLQLAVVLDAFGGTAGIVTMEDILEELVGEIQDEYDEEQALVEFVSENSFIVKASASIVDLNEILPKELPESDDYETLGGLITTETETIPESGEQHVLFGYNMVILNRSNRYIETVRLDLLSDE